MSGSDGEGFLGRWSRRKRSAIAAPRAAPVPDAPAGAPPAEAPPEFDPASLPPVESLTAGSDITPFLRPQVPAALRTAALRRAWTLDPAIRDYVGPADYAWDYNAPDGMAGFSLDLGGDVKRLLAQAIGLVEEEEKAPADEPGEAQDEAPGEVVAEQPAAAPGAPPSALAEALPGPPAEPVPEPPPATLAEAVPAPPPAAASPPPRRHGGARPV